GSHALRFAEVGTDKIGRMPDRPRDVDPAAGCVCASRRVDQALHTISLGDAGRGRAAALACINQSPHQATYWGDAGSGNLLLLRILNRDRLQRVVALTRESQLEATKVIGGGIRQDEGAVLAIELDAMPGAEERCAAHLQAAASARCESERQRNAAVRVPAGQRKQPRRKARDRAEKPFEIIKAMGYKVSQKPAATVAARLPALEAKARGSMFEVPSQDHILQAPDRASIQDRLGALP